MQVVTLRGQAHVPITAHPFPTYDRCKIVHGKGKFTIDDKLAKAMDEINFVRV